MSTDEIATLKGTAETGRISSSHGLSGYGTGDLRRLATEGSGSCHPEL